MSDIAIRVDHLSKRYAIGALQQRHDTLKDAISDFGARILEPIHEGQPVPIAPLRDRFGNRESEIGLTVRPTL